MVSPFGSLLRCLAFQMQYLKTSITKLTVPEESDVRLPVPYQYRYLKSTELMSGGGSRARVHWRSRFEVNGQLKKKCSKPSLLTVSLSAILQKVHIGDTKLSKAFIRLFSGSVLFLRRNKKFRKSLGREEKFHRPKAFFID